VAITRIKSRWRDTGREHSLDEVAGALAYISWKVALESAKDLHREGYEYISDPQRVSVIAELVAFLVQCADRLAFETLEDEDRDLLVNALARRLADQVQDNLTDLFGPGDYRGPFIDTLNERLADYSELTFADGKPGYDLLRFLGSRILKIMGETQTNRWVIDQIMDRSGPEAFHHLRKSLHELLE
jgi:hypothetical protein